MHFIKVLLLFLIAVACAGAACSNSLSPSAPASTVVAVAYGDTTGSLGSP
jgi:hypothetical protein